MDSRALYDLSPLLRMALLGVVLAIGPLAWIWLRQRRADPPARLRALTVLTLFLTFDLVLFGAFTRLSDSGLGCPDWPGCYGSASPLGAIDHIATAQRAMPGGPVTHGKAWVEMIHRYLATVVGVLIFLMAVGAWWMRLRRADRFSARSSPSPWWATATLVWVCVQGAFGALTVTMKLYPAIVTAHLLGGLVLLALLAAQSQAGRASLQPALPPTVRVATGAVLALAAGQIALGGWVSTNYAVLACSDFPTCQGSWWPPMDAARGFTLWRALGTVGGPSDAIQGSDWLPFAALTAIHMAHRVGAVVALAAMGALAWRLDAFGRAHGGRVYRMWAFALAGIAVWQAGSGIGNVVLGWPLAAALAHTAGAAALVVLLTTLLSRSWRQPPRPAVAPAFPAVQPAS